MNYQIRALGIFLLLTTAGSYAQNETASFSASIKHSENYRETPQGEITDIHNSALSYKHVFAISPGQEAALSQDGLVEIDFDEFDAEFYLSEDPKWQPGNTSAKINVIRTLPNKVVKISASLKWGNGQCSVSAKVSSIYSYEGIAIKSPRVPGHPNSTTDFETDFESASLDFEANGYVTFDSKSNETETIKADGSKTEVESFSMKSRDLVNEPI